MLKGLGNDRTIVGNGSGDLTGKYAYQTGNNPFCLANEADCQKSASQKGGPPDVNGSRVCTSTHKQKNAVTTLAVGLEVGVLPLNAGNTLTRHFVVVFPSLLDA